MASKEKVIKEFQQLKLTDKVKIIKIGLAVFDDLTDEEFDLATDKGWTVAT